MERNRSNKFGSAVRHLKSNQIDEKLELLSEIPTNNIGNLYSIEPEFNVQDPDVPGEVTREADFTQDDSASDTTGLFDDDGVLFFVLRFLVVLFLKFARAFASISGVTRNGPLPEFCCFFSGSFVFRGRIPFDFAILRILRRLSAVTPPPFFFEGPRTPSRTIF